MQNNDLVFQESTRALLHELLRARGLDLRDFEIDDTPPSEFGPLMGDIGGMTSVRCRSTGEERLYATGPGSAWVAELLNDLQAGLFGQANRQPPAPPVPPTPPSVPPVNGQ